MLLHGEQQGGGARRPSLSHRQAAPVPLLSLFSYHGADPAGRHPPVTDRAGRSPPVVDRAGRSLPAADLAAWRWRGGPDPVSGAAAARGPDPGPVRAGLGFFLFSLFFYFINRGGHQTASEKVLLTMTFDPRGWPKHLS
jgi:hypothetical protein